MTLPLGIRSSVGLIIGVFGGLGLIGCGASRQTQVRRLNPILSETSAAPKECRLVSVLKDSPAAKAGLSVGARIHAVNGVVPSDALALSDLVSQSPADMDLEMLDSHNTLSRITVHLNNTRPRLGAVCDLTGLRKTGVTPAGNESLSVYEGPFGLTASAIIDKGVVFMRVRATNNSDHALTIGPELFSAADAHGTSLAVLSPQQVMCDFYGEKGAHLLALKRQKKQSLEVDSLSKQEARERICPAGGVSGRLSNSNAAYAEANAEYLAAESLWPSSYTPGQTADGLIFLQEPSVLPVTLKADFEGREIEIALGNAQASQTQKKRSELDQFFQSQKRGAPLRLTLRKSRVFVGKFQSYDPDNERAWFIAPTGGLLNSVSFPLNSIRDAEPIEPLPPKPEATSGNMP